MDTVRHVRITRHLMTLSENVLSVLVVSPRNCSQTVKLVKNALLTSTKLSIDTLALSIVATQGLFSISKGNVSLAKITKSQTPKMSRTMEFILQA